MRVCVCLCVWTRMSVHMCMCVCVFGHTVGNASLTTNMRHRVSGWTHGPGVWEKTPSSVTVGASILVSVPLEEGTEGYCRWKRLCSWHLQRPET